MKRIRWILLAVVLLAAAGIYVMVDRYPRDNGNYPPEPDTPVPDPHNGLFVSDHGSMEFNGDGSTIIIDFDTELAELSGLSEGRQEGTYTFLSGVLPPHGSFDIRYDAAHELRITAGDTSVVLDLGVVTEDGTVQKYLEMVTPETIPMVLYKDGKPVPIVFELQN
ncbi:MAG: hypothetical protein IJJ00_08295 [Erysipelotrichaceae bacterium]|nr:hypothetical protein [Erysipelotrichaceae bacterium]